MSTLGKTWQRIRCNRGHLLEHNRTGKKGECRECKSLRNKKYAIKKLGYNVTLDELAKDYKFFS